MGGDLKGVDQKLDYLQSLGVNTHLLQPDLRRAAPTMATTPRITTRSTRTSAPRRTGTNLVKHAKQRGIEIVLDGVFNHMSSDSPFFDRYHHYADAWARASASFALPQLVHLPRCAAGTRHLRAATAGAN